jgi:hypothetical protein
VIGTVERLKGISVGYVVVVVVTLVGVVVVVENVVAGGDIDKYMVVTEVV